MVYDVRKHKGKARQRRAGKAGVPHVDTPQRLPDADRARQRAQRAERALLQYWRLLDALLAAVPDIIALKNRRGVYIAASAAFCQFVGQTEQYIRGKTDAQLFPSALIPALRRHDNDVLTGRRALAYDETLRIKSGILALHITKAPVFGSKGACAGVLCAIRDVTETRRLRDANAVLARAATDPFCVLDEKDIFIDVNHAYCVLTGYGRDEIVGRARCEIEAMVSAPKMNGRRGAPPGPGCITFRTRTRTKAGQMMELEVAAIRIDNTTGRRMQFYRVMTPAPAAQAQHHTKTLQSGPVSESRLRSISLNDVLRRALTLQARTISASIRVVHDMEADLYQVMADPMQLLQIVTNLLTNAVEAIPGRGQIRIVTRNIDVANELAMIYPHLKPGRYAFLSIEDTGRGIPPDLLGKIFDPFITTKEDGRGMGLAMAQRNARAHGGHITVKSQVGRGSTFCVFLPACEAAQAPEDHVISAPVGTETILLVDQDAVSRRAGREMLERLGYKVVSVEDIVEALNVLRDYPADIHLGLFDTTVAGVNDPRFFKRIRRLRPRIKVAFTGAHGLNGMTQDLLDNGAACFIAKPLRIGVLAPAIRHALDE